MPGDNEGYLAVDGEKVYAAVATSQENGFTGIITVNPLTGEITKRTSSGEFSIQTRKRAWRAF